MLNGVRTQILCSLKQLLGYQIFKKLRKLLRLSISLLKEVILKCND